METLTLYFDRCFGKRFPQALKTLGLPVEFQHDKKPHFKENTPDDVWLAEVGKRNWIVFSHDQKFHLLPSELSAIKQHKVGCFYLWGANSGPWDKAKSFARAYEKILKAALESKKPFIYKVTKSGVLQKVRIP